MLITNVHLIHRQRVKSTLPASRYLAAGYDSIVYQFYLFYSKLRVLQQHGRTMQYSFFQHVQCFAHTDTQTHTHIQTHSGAMHIYSHRNSIFFSAIYQSEEVVWFSVEQIQSGAIYIIRRVSIRVVAVRKRVFCRKQASRHHLTDMWYGCLALRMLEAP